MAADDGLSRRTAGLTAGSAADAAAGGLIWACVYDDQLMAKVGEIAARFAKGPTVAYGLIKEAFRRSPTAGLDEQLALEARLQARAGKTADFAEGVSAFLEGRKPAYRGR